jgi:hypothetical protein
VIKFASRSGSMVPGRRTSSIATPKLMVTSELGEIGQSPTGRHGGGRFDDVARLVSGGGMTTRDQALAQLGIAHGSQPVLDEQNVVVRVAVNRVKHRPAQCLRGRGGVAATFQGRGDLLATKLELAVEQGQEQFVFGSEVRVDRAFGESRGLTDRIDGGAGEPFGGEYFRGCIQDPVPYLAASGADPRRLDRRHGRKHTPRYRVDTRKYRKVGWDDEL